MFKSRTSRLILVSFGLMLAGLFAIALLAGVWTTLIILIESVSSWDPKTSALIGILLPVMLIIWLILYVMVKDMTVNSHGTWFRPRND